MIFSVSERTNLNELEVESAFSEVLFLKATYSFEHKSLIEAAVRFSYLPLVMLDVRGIRSEFLRFLFKMLLFERITSARSFKFRILAKVSNRSVLKLSGISMASVDGRLLREHSRTSDGLVSLYDEHILREEINYIS